MANHELVADNRTPWNTISVRHVFASLTALSGSFGKVKETAIQTKSYGTGVAVEFERFLNLSTSGYIEVALNYSFDDFSRVDYSRTVFGYKFYPLSTGPAIQFSDQQHAISLVPKFSFYFGGHGGYSRVLQRTLTGIGDASSDSIMASVLAGINYPMGNFALSVKADFGFMFSFTKVKFFAMGPSVLSGITWGF